MSPLFEFINEEPPHPREILNNSGKWLGNNIFKYLSAKKNIEVLDIGCRVPQLLMICYHKFDTVFLRGVDLLKNEKTCIDKYINYLIKTDHKNNKEFAQVLRDNYCSTFYCFYKKLILSAQNSLRNDLLDNISFNKIITNNYLFNTSIENYIANYKDLFDVVICYNVLHFTQQSEKYISKIKSILKPDGIIFLSVESKNSYDLNEFRKELGENFESGYLFSQSLNTENPSITFINHEI